MQTGQLQPIKECWQAVRVKKNMETFSVFLCFSSKLALYTSFSLKEAIFSQLFAKYFPIIVVYYVIKGKAALYICSTIYIEQLRRNPRSAQMLAPWPCWMVTADNFSLNVLSIL
jgi:hypothetical protein